LYTPDAWSQGVNGDAYTYAAFVLQTAQAANVIIPGGKNYNVPSGNITFGDTGDASPPSLTSYTRIAIAGADDFNDAGVTIKDVFDVIVEITREVTPTCESLCYWLTCSFHQLDLN
jgi:hypothetical protein